MASTATPVHPASIPQVDAFRAAVEASLQPLATVYQLLADPAITGRVREYLDQTVLRAWYDAAPASVTA